MKVVKQYQLPYSYQTVFDAWVSEEMVVAPVTRIASTPEVGGQYILYVGAGDDQQAMVGEFKEITGGQRIVYTWNWQGSPETTLVSVEFSESNQGTKIELIHDGFESEESRALHDQGWDSYVTGLSKLLEKQEDQL